MRLECNVKWQTTDFPLFMMVLIFLSSSPRRKYPSDHATLSPVSMNEKLPFLGFHFSPTVLTNQLTLLEWILTAHNLTEDLVHTGEHLKRIYGLKDGERLIKDPSMSSRAMNCKDDFHKLAGTFTTSQHWRSSPKRIHLRCTILALNIAQT